MLKINVVNNIIFAFFLVNLSFTNIIIIGGENDFIMNNCAREVEKIYGKINLSSDQKETVSSTCMTPNSRESKRPFDFLKCEYLRTGENFVVARAIKRIDRGMQVAIVGCVPKSQENGGVTFLETKMIESDNSTTFVFQRKFVPGSILSLPRPIPFYKKFPVIDLHLPFDFFYPFVSD